MNYLPTPTTSVIDLNQIQTLITTCHRDIAMILPKKLSYMTKSKDPPTKKARDTNDAKVTALSTTTDDIAIEVVSASITNSESDAPETTGA